MSTGHDKSRLRNSKIHEILRKKIRSFFSNFEFVRCQFVIMKKKKRKKKVTYQIFFCETKHFVDPIPQVPPSKTWKKFFSLSDVSQNPVWKWKDFIASEFFEINTKYYSPGSERYSNNVRLLGIIYSYTCYSVYFRRSHYCCLSAYSAENSPY